MPFVFDWRGLTDDVLRGVLDQLRSRAGGDPAPRESAAGNPAPVAGTPGLDAWLPPRVGAFARTHLNDRFGGLDQGGIHAAYDAAGHPIRVLVRRCATSAQAAAMAEDAPRDPGHAAWAEDRVWFFISGGTVLGDEDPSFAPGDVAAVGQFVDAYRAQRTGSAR
jgi:hypothetical protein